jgi:hypothetical protein
MGSSGKDRVSKFGSWTLVPSEHRDKAIEVYGRGKVTTGHIHGKRAMPYRVDGQTENIGHERSKATRHGREVYAEVHPRMHLYGHFPTHDSRGRARIWLYLSGNFPGLVEAAHVFGTELTNYFEFEKFTRGTVDPCTYVRVRDTGLVTAQYHVDDMRTGYDQDKGHSIFSTSFAKRFAEDPHHMHDPTDEYFTGMRTKVCHHRVREIAGERALKNLAAKIHGKPFPQGVESKYPLPVNAMRVLQEGPTPNNPLTPHLLEEGQEILGGCGHAGIGWRPDACFAFTALAAHTKDPQSLQLRIATGALSGRLSTTASGDCGARQREGDAHSMTETLVDSAHASGPDGRS